MTNDHKWFADVVIVASDLIPPDELFCIYENAGAAGGVGVPAVLPTSGALQLASQGCKPPQGTHSSPIRDWIAGPYLGISGCDMFYLGFLNTLKTLLEAEYAAVCGFLSHKFKTLEIQKSRYHFPSLVYQGVCCAVVIGDHVASTPEQLEGLLANEGTLQAAGEGAQLFAFDHLWSESVSASNFRVNAVLYAPLGAPCFAPLLAKLQESAKKLDGTNGANT